MGRTPDSGRAVSPQRTMARLGRAWRAARRALGDLRHARENRRERDRLRGERDRLRGERDRLVAELGRLSAETAELRSARADLQRENADVWAQLTPYLRGWPPGHFYSPIPSLDEVRRREEAIFAPPPPGLPELDLGDERQVALFRELAPSYADQPWYDTPSEGRRYGFANTYFTYGEALIYHALLRRLRPRRVVEVGSGHSSAVLLDTNDLFLGGAVRCTFVEPFPERLESLLRPEDRPRVDLLRSPLQEVDLGVFEALAAGDVLFVDSTHVAKVDSDVNHALFRVLPALGEGVWIHFHDVFYPFEYPREWVLAGRSWNEAYLLRALLQGSRRYEIAFFNDYFAAFHRDELERGMPLAGRNPGSSLWLRKTARE